MTNSLGKIYRLTTFGESHSVAIGGIIDGFPPNIEIDIDFIQSELDKRKPGIGKLTSSRKEPDKLQILSGIFENKTLGTPIGYIIPNTNQKTSDYQGIKEVFRPGHADYTYQNKYKIRDYRGGGRASARETANWVVAGAFAKILLRKKNIEIRAFVSQVGSNILEKSWQNLNLLDVYKYPTRCPDDSTNKIFEDEILKTQKNHNSIGGTITCVITNAPIGLGEPVFNKFHANLAQAVMSINACKSFEIGLGSQVAETSGLQNNDKLCAKDGNIYFTSNNSGGVLGGITTGQDILFRAAFKPTPSILSEQNTIDKYMNNTTIKISGRHDPCVVPRAVVVVEAVTAITLLDFILINNAKKDF